jgi:hypothetical protein
MVVRRQPTIFGGCAIERSLWSCTERNYCIASVL